MKLLDVLACPACSGALRGVSVASGREADEIGTGELRCVECDRRFPIVNGIPRFVSGDNYASSFGLQ